LLANCTGANQIPELEMPRLRLRALGHADFDAYAAMWKEAEVVRFFGGAPFTREAAWARFLRQMGAPPGASKSAPRVMSAIGMPPKTR
jgi:RimJ/RimL family protein N-acetyltransferase